MENNLTSTAVQQQQGRTLLLFLVVVGYIVTFITAARGTAQFSVVQVVVGVLFGVVYLILGMFDLEIFGHFQASAGNISFFTIQCALVLGIGLTLGPGGNWLIGLPLAGIAVDRLAPRWRWLVYVGLLAAIILPIAYYSTWEAAFTNTLIISTAILFVVIFSQIRVNEQQARIKAEDLAKQLEAANRRLTKYASQAEELAATQERNRLAREIHDNLGHFLTIVNVQIEAAKVTFESDPGRALDALNKAQELAKKGLNSVRESVAALRVSPIDNRPLGDAIAELVEESQSSGIPIHFSVTGESRSIETRSALALYRAAQEGLTNIRKHSHASRVDIELDFSLNDKVRLVVRDDGVGAADTSGGFGLIGIRERVQMLGGEFKVELQPNQGFCFEVTLPDEGGEGL